MQQKDRNVGLLVYLGCYNKIPEIGWLINNKTLISHCSGGWEVQAQCVDRFSVWREPTSWFIDSMFPPCPHMAEGARELFRTSFIRALIPFVLALPSWPNHLPNPLSPNTTTLCIRFQHTNFGEIKHSDSNCVPNPNCLTLGFCYMWEK